MANKYCDHGLYGAYAAIPTWGNAQDGDGTAQSAATPSTAEVVFTGIPSTGTIAVLGVTLAPTWATSASICADNLATAINASTSAATGPASFTVKSQVRNHVYARGPSAGAPADTCQIMTRQASAAHAGLIAVTHTLNNVSSAGTINFAGGIGGAWGYLFHTATLWPSAIAAGGYGIWGAIYTGAQVDGDVVHIRANNKTITNTNQGLYVIPLTTLAVNSPVYHIIGDPAIWTADSASSTLTINNYATAGAYSLFLQLHGTKRLIIKGRELSKDVYNLKLSNTGTAGTWGLNINNDCAVDGFNLEVTTASTTPLVNVAQTLASPSTGRARLSNGTVKHNATSSFWSIADGYTRLADYENIVFDNGVNASLHNGIFSIGAANTAYIEISVKNARFKNFVVGSKLFSTSGISANDARFNFINTDFGNVTSRGPYLGALAGSMDFGTVISSFSQLGKRDFAIDNATGMTAWNSTLGQPVLSATLPDGVEKWSIIMAPITTAGKLSPNRPLVSPRIAKINSLATGQRTIKMQICISAALAWAKNNVSMLVMYPDATTGEMVQIDTFDYAGGALTASTVTWNQEVAGQVTYQSGGTLYHNKYELSVTTPTGRDIPLDAEVGVYFRVHTNVANATQFIFVDPDVSIT